MPAIFLQVITLTNTNIHIHTNTGFSLLSMCLIWVSSTLETCIRIIFTAKDYTLGYEHLPSGLENLRPFPECAIGIYQELKNVTNRLLATS